MQTPVHVFDNPQQLGRSVAEEIAGQMEGARREGRRYVLGCPGGRTARSTYGALAEVIRERELRLDHVVIAMMDEYVEYADGQVRPVSADAHNSCRRFGEQEIIAPLNAAATAPVPGPAWVPDPTDPAGYEERLADVGGIDLFLLASGETDGHVAFNPPGSGASSRTRVVELAESTRCDNLNTFPEFGSLDNVPSHGVTVGIATITELARHLVMVLVGEHKRAAFERITVASAYDPTWPATLVHDGASATIVADRAAAGAA